ncbi:transcription antitermination factor NusB [Bacillota bacterium Meth-B3]|nr:transcription antitermination factor NusB [Christensenellaceae bacterium]MEA5070215.1 transcription antitermination factor NusB [Christensenellaceae bacterium]
MNRTEARAAAMKLIYEWEMGGDGGEDTLAGILEIKPGEEEYDYMRRMVDGVIERADELDRGIERFAQGWTIARLTKVDLAILRLGAHELALGEVPAGVAVNEAVELSRIYSTDKAGSFINGVLGSMMRAAQK